MGWLFSSLQLSVLWPLCAVAAMTPSIAGDPSSLSEFKLDATEARVALELALEENALLREKIAVAEATAAKLTESLAIANSEAEVFRRQSGDLKLKLEALGVDAVGGNTGKLEQRLLKAVNDLRLSEEKRKLLNDAVLSLSEAVVRFLKVSSTEDSEARVTLEAQLRHASAAVTASPESNQNQSTATAVITDAAVISIKEELSLIVANVGSKHGVKVGMPFTVLRNNLIIGTIRVVDVRDRIAGALVQNLTSEKEKIRVGDRLKVEAQP
jgi:hypothetical protein